MLQIAIRRADNASGIQLLFLVVSYSSEAAVLQNMQQFRLKARIKLGNFVQEKRASISHLHAAWFGRVRSGEGALLKSK